MKAAVCREFKQPLTIEDVDIALPGPGEVMVKLAACAICHSDLIFMDGGWGGQLPAVYGHEASGIVQSVGSGVETVIPGDHVVVTLIRSCGYCHYCAQGMSVACETSFPLDTQSPLCDTGGSSLTHGLGTGAFAEFVLVHTSQAIAIDKTVPLISASLLACGVLTGFGAVVNTARVPAGSSVVVVGTGGVGLNTVQGAAISGAATIIAVDISPAKLQVARTFGATHTIEVSKVMDEGKMAQTVRAMTSGRGADYVFVTVGAKSAIDSAYELIGPTGAVVLVGMPASGVMSEFEPVGLSAQNQRILGSKMGSSNTAVDIPYLVSLYQQGRLKLDELISGQYPLDDINEAIASSRSGEALRNIIVF